MLAVFNTLRASLQIMPMAVKSSTEAMVGMRRLKNFLLLDENVVKVEEVRVTVLIFFSA